MIIVAPDGTEVECFISGAGGMIDAVLRAESRDAWEQAAVAAEVLEPVTLDGGATTLSPVPGNHIDEIGPVMLTPGAYAEDGTEVSAPIIDSRYHVNLRLTEPALSKRDDMGYLKWETTVLTWMQHGVDDANANKSEIGKLLQQVTLIDPGSINTKKRAWL